MPRIKLTPTSVRTAQAKGKDRTIFWDAHMPGFGLQVTSTGEKSYVIQYRANRRSRRMFIGRDGVLNLDAARKLAKAKLGEVAHDRDPLQERRDKIARERYTFRAVADTYLAREGKKLRTSTSRERRRTLERLVYPEFGSRPIAEIRRSEIVKLLDKIEDNNGAVMADRTLGHVRKIMNWHATRDDDFRSPIVMGMARTSAKERAKTRSLSDDELQAVWKAADKTEGPFGAFVKFLLLTAARRAEGGRDVMGRDQGWCVDAARRP
jgi:hypothetical protein